MALCELPDSLKSHGVDWVPLTREIKISPLQCEAVSQGLQTRFYPFKTCLWFRYSEGLNLSVHPSHFYQSPPLEVSRCLKDSDLRAATGPKAGKLHQVLVVVISIVLH